jgi:hypothetical protein
MKTCPVCALDVEDTYLFCPEDGSGLDAISGTSANKWSSRSEVDDQTTGAVVLYCPACAAEYPLTFSECPTHAVKLTRHNLSRLPNTVTATAAGPELKQPAANIPNQPISLELMQSHPNVTGNTAEPAIADSAAGFDYPRRNSVSFAQEFGAESKADSAGVFDYPRHNSVSFAQEFDTESSYTEPLTEPDEQGFERPRFRVAAIATVIALAVFALVGMYALLSSVSRRPSVRVAQITEASPQPFVPTPQEAQDYKEEQPTPIASTPPEPQPDRTARLKNHDASSTAERSTRNKAVDQSGAKAAVESRPESLNSAKASVPPMPALPRGNSGGFDARLIRVRSNKTSSGIRYDLTFNMQEQAGRSAQWQRVLISTRSVSGVNHSQAIPFAHRLGAAGALTFTISVELAGRSEADWQGRVVCTTLGWDNQGGPLQARFGANLTP